MRRTNAVFEKNELSSIYSSLHLHWRSDLWTRRIFKLLNQNMSAKASIKWMDTAVIDMWYDLFECSSIHRRVQDFLLKVKKFHHYTLVNDILHLTLKSHKWLKLWKDAESTILLVKFISRYKVGSNCQKSEKNRYLENGSSYFPPIGLIWFRMIKFNGEWNQTF